MEPRPETICWRCDNATGGCSWADELIPVNGWEALRQDIKIDGVRYRESYIVFDCPKYHRTPRKRRR